MVCGNYDTVLNESIWVLEYDHYLDSNPAVEFFDSKDTAFEFFTENIMPRSLDEYDNQYESIYLEERNDGKCFIIMVKWKEMTPEGNPLETAEGYIFNPYVYTQKERKRENVNENN